MYMYISQSCYNKSARKEYLLAATAEIEAVLGAMSVQREREEERRAETVLLVVIFSLAICTD